MKKIIVPIDFSDHSQYALKVAADLAQKNNAEIFLLHMLEITENLISRSEIAGGRELLFFMKLGEKRLEEAMNQDFLKGIKITPIIKHFKVFKEVSEVAEEIQADLIIMGSRGASGIKGALVGSNTEKVVRHSNIPVLVIKKDMNNFSIKTIAFASDFHEENIPVFQKMKMFAKKFNAKIKLLYVNTPTSKFRSTPEIREQMRIFLNKNKMSVHAEEIVVFNDYTIEDGILNGAEHLQADIITIPTHGRKGLQKLLAGSISEDIANHANIPVMTIKI